MKKGENIGIKGPDGDLILFFPLLLTLVTTIKPLIGCNLRNRYAAKSILRLKLSFIEVWKMEYNLVKAFFLEKKSRF